VGERYKMTGAIAQVMDGDIKLLGFEMKAIVAWSFTNICEGSRLTVPPSQPSLLMVGFQVTTSTW